MPIKYLQKSNCQTTEPPDPPQIPVLTKRENMLCNTFAIIYSGMFGRVTYNS